MKQQAEIYKVAGVDDEAPALDPVKKRKADQEDVSGTSQEQSFFEFRGKRTKKKYSSIRSNLNSLPLATSKTMASVPQCGSSTNTPPQSESNKKSKASASGGAESKPKAERRSTAVFVSGLPSDVDVEEVRTCFQKFGIIAESPDDNEKLIKLYNDKVGNFKG